MPKFYNTHRSEPYFTFMKNGQKTIEGRLNRGKFESIRPRDHVMIYNSEETKSIEAVVKRVQKYPTFRELLENEQLKSVLPDAESVDQGVEIYHKFYPENDEKKYGVLAIEVKIV